MRYLIIGNSAAAVGAIEAIRQEDRKGSITVLSSESHPSYCKPLISYYLAGKVSEKEIVYRKPEFYRKNRIDLLLGKRVERVNPKENILFTDGRGTFRYEKLLIASGGIPLMPPLNGVEAMGLFHFTNLDDARAIKEYIREGIIRKAVVIGGGLIGLKATEALMELSLEVTLVELADRILSVTFDHRASQIMSDQLQGAGASLITQNTVTKIQSNNGRVCGVVLQDGSMLECQLVIVAIGVKPNTDFIEDSGVSINRGILVDRHMQTNLPNTFAAGDVVEVYDALVETHRSIPIWPNAFNQGTVAGYNMVGRPREYEGGFFMNSVEICSLPSISVGITDPNGNGYETMDHYDRTRMTYKKLVLKENRLVGAIFIGDIDRAGIYTGLIKQQLDVGEFRENLMRDDFGLISLPTAYRKHLISGEEVES